jgi:hypothetical protein
VWVICGEQGVRSSYLWVCYTINMTSTNREPRVDAYTHSLPDWQDEICQRVRELVHQAEPEIVETIKRSKLPYFVLNGNVCALLGTRDHVNVFIYDPIAPDPEHIINQGSGNATARAIQIYRGDILNEKAFINLIKAIADNNRKGGWRKIKE